MVIKSLRKIPLFVVISSVQLAGQQGGVDVDDNDINVDGDMVTDTAGNDEP